MITNQLRTDPTSRTRPPHVANTGVQWLADIICHLRDDLAVGNPVGVWPQNGDIQGWVAESFYPGLLELTWEEAIHSLLTRMQKSTPRQQSRKADFAEEAMTQLHRATQSSQIWRL